MSTLEVLLGMKVPAKDKDGNPVEIQPDFLVKVQQTVGGRPHIVVHALGFNSETLDFVVNGNKLVPLNGESSEN